MHIKQLLEKHNIKPLKSRDQFFLQVEEILDFEIRLAGLEKTDTVLEIGAGTGNLTERIAKHCKAIAIESDGRFLPLLKQIKNAKIIIGDALNVLQEMRTQVIRKGSGLPPKTNSYRALSHSDNSFNKIISNIPYGKSQDILIELLQHRWQKAVLCVQREFAEKLQGKSKLGIVANDCCKLTYASDVPPDAFYPTAVESAIIILEQRRLLDLAFWRFLDLVYRKKNKDVKNLVKNAPKELARKKVHQLDINEMKALFQCYQN